MGVPDIDIKEDIGMARILFGEEVLFASGKAELKESAEPLLLAVGERLKTAPYTIVVEGHTDNVPFVKEGKYKNNRELSLARSMSVVRLLINKGGVNPAHLASAAYGSYRPKTTNLTLAGQAVNRRVEIALLEDFTYAAPPIEGEVDGRF